jgi:hypothetical protein
MVDEGNGGSSSPSSAFNQTTLNGTIDGEHLIDSGMAPRVHWSSKVCPICPINNQSYQLQNHN